MASGMMRRSATRRRSIQETLLAYGLLPPALVLFLVFTVFPLGFGVVISL